MTQEPFGIPKVFLSCSDKDSEFMEKLADDFNKKCQIHPWLYKYELRHGKPWLDSIFSGGLPTCDAIIAYITESSLTSAVVSKEIDAAIIQKLHDNNVAFLPYVNDAKIRSLLRADIQALQVPEWNVKNYLELLPSVVAEVWRSFLERTISTATKDERLKRVEAELALEKNRSQNENVFSDAENAEFDYIWKSFDQRIILSVSEEIVDTENQAGSATNLFELVLELSTVITSLNIFSNVKYDDNYVRGNIRSKVISLLGKSSNDPNSKIKSSIKMDGLPELTDQLLTFGLIETFQYPNTLLSTAYSSSNVFREWNLTKKYFRFKFWLAFHKKLPDEIIIKIL